MTIEVSPQFSYFLNQKKTILVVSLLGHIDSDSAAPLERCQAEILASTRPNIVLNFKGIVGVSESQITNLMHFQRSIRAIPAELVICELSATLKRELEKAGGIRSYEVQPTLIAALQYIINNNPTG